MKNKIQIENVNLIRKIAWELKKKQRGTTKESFDDLFQEGYIGYLKAKETYNPVKGAFSTHAWYCISSAIKDYLKSMEHKNALLNPMLTELDFQIICDTEEISTDFFEGLPQESLEIAEVILSAPKSFIGRTSDDAKCKIIEILQSDGWSFEKVCFGMSQLTKACAI